MIYTWRDLKATLSNPLRSLEVTNLINSFKELFEYVDIIVDGEYKMEERLWDGEKCDGLLSSVGSGNQTIWNINKKFGFKMRDIDLLFVTKTNKLQYTLKDINAPLHRLNY